MLDQGVDPPTEGGGGTGEWATTEELKTGEIEKRNDIQKDITGVYLYYL